MDLPTRVLVCPQCGESILFSTDWKDNTTQFWAFGMDRLNRALLDDHTKWKKLMNGDPDCGFCEKLHHSEADAMRKAEDYTYEHFPDINDDPPLL